MKLPFIKYMSDRTHNMIFIVAKMTLKLIKINSWNELDRRVTDHIFGTDIFLTIWPPYKNSQSWQMHWNVLVNLQPFTSHLESTDLGHVFGNLYIMYDALNTTEIINDTWIGRRQSGRMQPVLAAVSHSTTCPRSPSRCLNTSFILSLFLLLLLSLSMSQTHASGGSSRTLRLCQPLRSQMGRQTLRGLCGHWGHINLKHCANPRTTLRFWGRAAFHLA